MAHDQPTGPNAADAAVPPQLWHAALQAAAGRPALLLQVGEEQSVVWAGRAATPDQVWTLPLGERRLGTGRIRHDPPTADELERAIMAVEDEVMPLARQLPPDAALVSAAPRVRQIAHAAGLPDAPSLRLPLDEVERVYNLLADVAQGRPAAAGGVRTDPAFAATLTLLREFMHHLALSEVRVLPPPDQTG